MNSLKAEYQVEELAHVLEVSSSGFYAHQLKPAGARAQEDQKLLDRIKPIFTQSRRTYGSPRVTAAGKPIESAAKTAFCSAHHAKQSRSAHRAQLAG
jgi:hypothetical protein